MLKEVKSILRFEGLEGSTASVLKEVKRILRFKGMRRFYSNLTQGDCCWTGRSGRSRARLSALNSAQGKVDKENCGNRKPYCVPRLGHFCSPT